MLLKRLVIVIIFFYPVMLTAQQSTKNSSSKVNGLVTKKKIIKNTYDQDIIKYKEFTKPIYFKIDSVNKLIRKKYDVLLKLSESPAKNIVQHDIDNLSKIADQLKAQATTLGFKFIKNNPSSFVSLDILSSILMRSAELPLYDTIKSLFNNLNKNIQNSVSGKQFKLLVVNMKKSEVGKLALDFTVNDVNSHPISLSSFRNKQYVLLDFWASWCAPCRDDFPFLKDIYKRYNEKGLEIIGISQDYNLSLWKSAIAKDSIQMWKHILVLNNREKINTSITEDYFIYGIPVKVLINKEGVIIGRWTGGGDENIAELKKLLNEVFGK